MFYRGTAHHFPPTYDWLYLPTKIRQSFEDTSATFLQQWVASQKFVLDTQDLFFRLQTKYVISMSYSSSSSSWKP